MRSESAGTSRASASTWKRRTGYGARLTKSTLMGMPPVELDARSKRAIGHGREEALTSSSTCAGRRLAAIADGEMEGSMLGPSHNAARPSWRCAQHPCSCALATASGGSSSSSPDAPASASLLLGSTRLRASGTQSGAHEHEEPSENTREATRRRRSTRRGGGMLTLSTEAASVDSAAGSALSSGAPKP